MNDELNPSEESGKVGDPPIEEQESGGDTPSGAPAPDEAEQGPSGPPPESIPGDSGEVPNPSQN